MPELQQSRPIERAERARPQRPAATTAPSPAEGPVASQVQSTPHTHADGLSGLLGRAVLDRAATRVLQRYELLQSAAVGAAATAAGEYRVLGVGAAEFEAQVVDVANQTIGAPATAAAPPVRVSDDGHMAIEHANLATRQPKVFYASPAVWAASNVALTTVGSDYELYADRAGALEVRLANGTQRTLDRVLARTRAIPAGGRLAGQQGLTLDASQDCIDMAHAVMKHALGARAPHLAIATAPRATWNEFRAAKALVAWANTPQAGFMSLFSNPTTKARQAFEADPTATLQAIATSYSNLMVNNPVLAAQAATALGLNIAAAPNVGEAYETYRISTVATAQTGPRAGGGVVRNFWGQHIGAVIAQSGGDRVTLENYARTHEIGAMRTAPDYYFQMYGPANKPQQTWHATWAVTAHGAPAIPVGVPAAAGSDALTVVIRH
jgi:hypothetical protein